MSELLTDVLNKFQDRPRTAILMSGGGSHARTILANEQIRDLYDIDVIVSDNPRSNAASIAETNSLDLIIDEKRRMLRTPEARQEYFDVIARQLGERGIEAIMYAGFMKIVSPDFAQQFPGINVHPADLTIKGPDGVALFRGMDALPLMRQSTGGELAASVHVVDNPVDTGSVISVSNSIQCPPEWTDDDCHQELQKQERIIYPKTLIALARGGLTLADLPLKEATI